MATHKFFKPFIRRWALRSLSLFLLVVCTFLLSASGISPAKAAWPFDLSAQVTFLQIDNFQNLFPGGLNGQNGWNATTGVTVAGDPADASNLVLRMAGADQRAYKGLPASIATSATGTLHFRLRRSGTSDAFAGAADVGSPVGFDAFESQFGVDDSQPSTFRVRDGGEFKALANTFAADTWYCVWLVQDNGGDSYQAYVQGGVYAQTTQLNAGGQTQFAFRNGGGDPLSTFLTLSGNSSGTVFLDDLYVDAASVNLSAPGGSCGSAPVTPVPSDTPAPAGYQVVETFQGLSPVGVNGQNGWTGSSGATVAGDPADGSNLVLRMAGSEESAYKALPASIANSATGTLHFRLRRSGTTDGFAGASDEAAPGNFSAYETQFGNTSDQPTVFRVRDGGSFKALDSTFASDTWYCVWLVQDNGNDSYQAYVQGGIYGQPTQLGAGGQNQFAFRNGGGNPLSTFLARTGDNSGTVFLDDVYVDAGAANLSAPGGSCNSAPVTPVPTLTTPVPGGFQAVETFQGLSTGAISGQNGWSGDNGATVAGDPAGGSNLVLRMAGQEQGAYKALPAAVANSATGTLHFRLRRSGTTDGFAGTSDEAAPAGFNAYETQFGNTSDQPATFRVRDGGSFKSLDSTFAPDTWYCVWLVQNNASNQYGVFVQGGTYGQPTQLTASGQSQFAFRNGGGNPLTTFLARTGNNSGTVFVDDVYIDATATNLSAPGGSCESSPVTPVPTVMTPAPAGFQAVDTFQGLSPTGLNGQNGWNASSGSTISSDPVDGANQVLRMAGADQSAYKALPAPVPNSASSTLHFRLRRNGVADGFAGSSDESTPGGFEAFETQFGVDDSQPSAFRVRDGGAFKTLADTFAADTWYCVWLVQNNANDRYAVYLQGGGYTAPTQLNAGGQTEFAFRNGGGNPLTTFLARTGNSSGTFWLDDVYIDAAAANLSAPGGNCDSETPTPIPSAGFQVVDNFQGLSTNGVNGQNGWNGSNGATVSGDPAGDANLVLRMADSGQKAFKALPAAIANGNSGTLYLRIRRSGTTDAFAGTSDKVAPNGFDDFQTQLGVESRGEDRFWVRDGDSQRSLDGTFAVNTWYCVWLVNDNDDDRYQVFAQGGVYTQPTQLGDGGQEDFTFRNANGGSLTTFLAHTGNNSGTFYVDDIYIDPDSVNLAAPGGNCNSSVQTSNQPPTARGDSARTAKNTPLNGESVLTNDSDPNGDRLEIDTVPRRNPQHGTVEISPDGTYRYVPETDYVGDDTFIYLVCDDGSPVYCSQATVFIDVTETADSACFALQLIHSGDGEDPVASPTKSEGCDEEGHYYADEFVSLLASPASGWSVASWTGTANDAETQSSNYVRMPRSDHTVEVRYIENAQAVVDLSVQGLEVTQAIQDLNNSVRLVAGKPTYVRFHVIATVKDTTTTALLRVQQGTEQAVLTPVNSGGSITVRTAPSRGSLQHSFLFELPERFRTGTVSLTAELNPDRLPDETSYANNNLTTEVTFEPVATLNLVLYAIGYGNQIYPNDFHQDKFVDWLKRAYPLHSINLIKRSHYIGSLRPNCGQVNAFLQSKYTWDTQSRSLPIGAHYYGMVSDEGGFMRGCASSIPAVVASGPTGSSGYSWDVDGSYGDWYGGHELGHAYGRYHAMYCDAQGGIEYPYPDGRISPTLSGNEAIYGFDTGTWDIYDPQWKDVMTYCDNQWISDFTYEGILDYFQNNTIGVPGLGQSVGQSTGESVSQSASQSETLVDRLLVSGVIDGSTMEVVLNPAFVLPDAADIPSSSPGDYSIVLRDVAGAELVRYPFTPSELEPAPLPQGDDDRDVSMFLISEFVPYIDGTVEVQIEHQDVVLASIEAGAAEPDVSILAPSGGETLDAETVNVQWAASDADNDELFFNVRYSPDNGQTWEMVAQYVRGNSIDIDTNNLVRTQAGLFQVWASDGIHTAQSTMASTFIVPNHMPVVEILRPEEDVQLLSDEALVLEGRAFDADIGTMDGESLTWTSNINGLLGTGTLLTIEGLEAGVHTITLRADDGVGGVAAQSFQATVVSAADPVGLPNRLLVSPRSLLFDTNSAISTAQVAIDNQSSTIIPWTATTDAAWLDLSTNSGVTPDDLTISFVDTALAPGTYTAEILITSERTPDQVEVVNVTAVVPGSEGTSGSPNPVYLPIVTR